MGEEGNVKKAKEAKHQKSYFDVLGICCSSEVALIEKILKPLNGVHKVSVVVPSKTVIVVHDSLLISQHEILKALNQARLEASIRTYGSAKITKKWPSPYVLACGLLLLVSLFNHFFHPLRWFAIAAVLVGIKPIVLRGIAAVRRLTLDINILMLIAVGGAVALKDYTEAAFIVFLFTVAEWLESRASQKATAGMSSLMSMAPQKAVLAETGQVVDIEDVEINTIIAVKAGEVIPIDGIVVDGQSEVDERSLTGESFPVAKQANSPVWAGTLNIDGYISVRTNALSENSAIAKMTALVEEAQSSRSSTQRLIDSCTKYYTPAVVIVAAAVALIPLVVRVNNRRSWFQLALVLLVSACPCALVLSTPVATFCALLKASRMGFLIKGGDVLETLAKIRAVAFDKTGTITKGEFTVVEFQSISREVSLCTLLYWVSSIESKSSHPMAAALVDHARSYSIEAKPDIVKEFHIYPGEGICGEIEGRNIYIGNKRIAARATCDTVPDMEDMEEGATFGYVILDKVPMGKFAISDTCRRGAAEAIKELKSLGIKTAMLTGDSTEAAIHAQRQLNHGIEEVHAELLPEDKVRLIGKLKMREGFTAMVGDGLNDAPALAMANVGISMGISGSAVAMETSHITLMSNDIKKIPRAIRLARKTRRKIIENIVFSVMTKIAILAIAFAGHPLVWAAVLADVGTCLLVILNSMMLLKTRTSKEKKCSRSYGKTLLEKPKDAEHCATGVCGLPSTSGQLNSCCHDQKKAMDERMHNHCMDQDHEVESPSHSHCCQELVAETTTSTQEHLISIADARHNSDVLQNEHCCTNVTCSQKPDCVEDGPECNMKRENQTLGSEARCCSSSMCKDEKNQKRDACCGNHGSKCGKVKGCSFSQSQGIINMKCENQTLGNAARCCSSSTCKDKENQKSDECCGNNESKCGKLKGCSSSQSQGIIKVQCEYQTLGNEARCCSSGICKDRENQKSNECCGTNGNKCGKQKGFSSSQGIINMKSGYQTLGNEARCSSSSICKDKENQKSDECCGTDGSKCGKENGCSSSQGIIARRETGGCCKSYRKAYGKTDGCCASGSVQLPEIIIE